MPNINYFADSKPDFIERVTAQLLTAAKRSGFQESAIEDAHRLQESDGYSFDCALAIACEYWCSTDGLPWRLPNNRPQVSKILKG